MNRNLTLLVHFVLDKLLPPVLRDSRWLMSPLFRLVLGPKAGYYLDFKDKLPTLSGADLQQYYTLLADTFIKRDTDLNGASISAIKANVVGNTVLDIACGAGWLSRELAAQGLQVTGADFASPPVSDKGNPVFMTADITQLPFADQSFDTVVCTHTLEHVPDLAKALTELRRVCRQRLLIVVPCQREYRYSFDLHVHFFPYEYKLRAVLGPKAQISKAGGDFLAIEERAVKPLP